MARLLLIPDNEEGLVTPALVLKATDYWPRIFLHAIWRELQAGDNQGRRLLRVTYSGLDLVYMYEYPSAAAGERQVTQEDFTPELRLKQLLDTLGVRRFRVPPYACTSFVIGHIMHAHIIDARVLRNRVSQWSSSSLKLLCTSRSTFKIDPQNSSITTFRFCSADTSYNDHHPNAQTSSGFVLTSRLLQEGKFMIERVASDPLLNTADAYFETGDQYSAGIDEEQRSSMPRNPMRQHALFSKTAPAKSGRSASTTLPSLARSPPEDVFTETRPHDHAKRPYRGELTNTAPGRHPGTPGDTLRSFPTLPTLSSDSSGSSISTLATPASPSPAPRHVRRARGRLSLPAPTPTPSPAAAEPSRRRPHARMSLMFPLPTPATIESRAAHRKSLDLSEFARCRLWDAKGKDGDGRDNVRVREKENSRPAESLR